jgi:hypothetical protein
MLLIVRSALPPFASVTSWIWLELPINTLGKVKLAGVRLADGPRPVPLSLIE